jgi:hypothetical protein
MTSPLFNLIAFFVVLLAAAPDAWAENEENKKCPIMTNKSISDADSKVTYQGKDFYVCCGPCEKQFNKAKEAFEKGAASPA